MLTELKMKLNKIKLLNATQLKMIALICMIIDHIHEMFAHVGAPIWLTFIGRIVFPIFLFLAADSFHYTHNKKRYIYRLFIASVLMATGTMIITRLFPNDNIALMNNAFSTFFVAAIYMWSWDFIVDFVKTRNIKSLLKSIRLFLLPVITSLPLLLASVFENSPAVMLHLIQIGLIIPSIFSAEGGIALIMLGVFFYIFREKRIVQYIGFILLSIFIAYKGAIIQSLMIFALPFMVPYNGQKGSGHKWLFYIVYPLHIYLLYIISTLLF